VSQSVADSIREQYKSPVRVIHNGVDSLMFSPGGSRPSEHPIIGWVGRASDPVKDFDALVGVANRLAGRFTPVVVDGSPQDEDNECWLPTNGYVVRRQRWVDMPDYYRTIRGSGGFFFCSSRCEAFGLNILEAMACGCPVIAPSVGGIPELVVHGVSGYLYDRRDGVGGVLEAVDWLYSEDRYESVSQAGVARAREHFSAKVMSDKYATLYEEVLAASV
jgi:glycosyltransferase involved in cell wall biosynthesis